MQIATTHKNTDFDGMASLIAATLLYPDAVPVLPKAHNPNVRAFLSIHKDLFSLSRVEDIPLTDVKRLVVVDANQWSRLDRVDKLKENNDLEIIVWDHHTSESDLSPTWICQEPMGATITLMLREIRKQEIPLSPIQATLFLCGLYEDTGSLMFPSTTPEDARTAAFLLEQKADLAILRTFLQPAYGQKQKEVLFEMLKTADRQVINNWKISINVTKITGHVNNLSLVVHMYRDILNVDVAFGIFIRDESDKCIVIGRSGTHEVNIGSVMRSMGGGGHPGAGSAMLQAVNPDALKEWIVELLKGNQETSMSIFDLMSYPVHSIPPTMPMAEVADMLEEKGCTGLPVVDDGKLVGVISRRDFKKIKNKNKFKAPVKAFMSTRLVTITPDKSPLYAARLMVKHDVGRLPVLENDRVIGIVSRSDAMRFFYDTLPE
ncbi:MAG: CBS domain-containing protein [Thermodesulfobacteriota bacterium]|nr:CBS domain-containing protein [Thermodesulfobacteriota bacterium]